MSSIRRSCYLCSAPAGDSSTFDCSSCWSWYGSKKTTEIQNKDQWVNEQRETRKKIHQGHLKKGKRKGCCVVVFSTFSGLKVLIKALSLITSTLWSGSVLDSWICRIMLDIAYTLISALLQYLQYFSFFSFYPDLSYFWFTLWQWSHVAILVSQQMD